MRLLSSKPGASEKFPKSQLGPAGKATFDFAFSPLGSYFGMFSCIDCCSMHREALGWSGFLLSCHFLSQNLFPNRQFSDF